MTTTELPIGKRAKIRNIWMTNRVFCKQYVGKFNNESLQTLADLKLWITGISGNPHSIRGSGSSPRYALQDAKSRNLDMIKKLQQANEAIDEALSRTGENHV